MQLLSSRCWPSCWPTLRAVFIVVGAFCVVCVLLKMVVRPLLPTVAGDAHFFTPNVDVEVDNSRRIELADRFINDLSARESVGENAAVLAEADVVAMVIATARQGRYLTQMMAQLLEQIPRRFFGLSVQPVICSVDRRDTLFEEAARLSRFVPVVRLHTETVFTPSDLQKRLRWEAEDYYRCLNTSLSIGTRARFVLLLEDDAMVIPNFFPMLSSVIRQMEHRRYGGPVAYVKLYHPAYLRGIPFYFNCASCSILLSLLMMYIFRRYFLFSQKVLCLFLLLQVSLYFLLFKSMSYQFLADMRYLLTGSVYLTMPESCCTPAVLYSANAVPSLVQYLSMNPAGEGRAKDHILDEAPSKLGVTGLMTDTNLVVHIGRYSTLRPGPVKLESVLVVNSGLR